MAKKTGRPSQYKPEYCKMLEDHMAKGKAIKSFGAKIGVDETTIYEWFKVHPDFSQSKKVGESLSFDFWEDKGIDGLEETTIRDGNKVTNKRLNSAVWIFNMRNRFGWRNDPQPLGDDDANFTDE